jgi:hypothetical protein
MEAHRAQRKRLTYVEKRQIEPQWPQCSRFAELTQALPAEDFVWATPPGAYGTRSADSVLGVLEPGAVAACCARHTRGHRGDRDRKHRAGRRRRYRDPLRVTDGLFHVGSGVAIVDSAATTADAVRRALDAAELARAAPDTGTVRLLPTDGAERFARIGAKFLGRWPEASDIEIVDLATGTPILRS